MSTPTSPSARSAIWAESGDTTAPSTGEQQSGYAAGKPSRRKTNWLLNWIDNAIQWVIAQGYQTAANVASSMSSLHSTITDETTSAIGTALGTASGALASGITVAGSTATVAYARRLNFPGSSCTDALVCFRLTANSMPGSGSFTVTLSGGAAFAAGIDGASVTLATTVDNYTTAAPVVTAKVVDSTTLTIYTKLIDVSIVNAFDVWVRGH